MSCKNILVLKASLRKDYSLKQWFTRWKQRHIEESGLFLLFRFVNVHRRALLGVFCADILANVCSIVLVLLTAQVLAVFLGYSSVRSRLVWPTAWKAVGVIELLSGIGILLLVKLVIDLWRWRRKGVLSEDFTHYLRQLAFEQHLCMPPVQVEQRDVGRYLLRFSGDLGSAHRLVGRGLLQYAADFSLVLIGLLTIGWLHPPSAAFVGGLLLLLWAVGQGLSRRAGQEEAQRRRRKGQLLAFVSRTLHTVEVIQALNRQPRTERRFQLRANRVRETGYRYQYSAAWMEAWPFFAVQGQLFAALLFAWQAGTPGTHTLAVALILMTWRTPLSRLLKASLTWEKGKLSLRKMAELLRRPRLETPKVIPKNTVATALTLREVSLTLQGRQVLTNVTLHLARGKRICLFAPTGGGKTALTKLLLKVYSPTSGALFLNDLPAEQVPLNHWRQQIAVVSEAFPLVGRDLIDALSPGSGEAARQRTAQWLREWQSHFPELQHLSADFSAFGLLSTGQQRLLQAVRLVAAQKPFWILDEPWAGSDSETARRLAALLQLYGADKGILILTSNPHFSAQIMWEPMNTYPLRRRAEKALEGSGE